MSSRPDYLPDPPPQQVTHDDIASMTPEQINAARRAGALAEVVSTPPPPHEWTEAEKAAAARYDVTLPTTPEA